MDAVPVADEDEMMRERASRSSAGHDVDELDRARAREYALLATLLARAPDTELIGRLALLQGDATKIGMAHAALADAARRSSEAGAAREYFDLFVGLGEDQLLPYASHYLTGSLYGRPLVELRDPVEAAVEHDEGRGDVPLVEELVEPQHPEAGLVEDGHVVNDVARHGLQGKLLERLAEFVRLRLDLRQLFRLGYYRRLWARGLRKKNDRGERECGE